MNMPLFPAIGIGKADSLTAAVLRFGATKDNAVGGSVRAVGSGAAEVSLVAAANS